MELFSSHIGTTLAALQSLVPCFVQIVAYCGIHRYGSIRPIQCVVHSPCTWRRCFHVLHPYQPTVHLRNSTGAFVPRCTYNTVSQYSAHSIVPLHVLLVNFSTPSVSLRQSSTLPAAFVVAVNFRRCHLRGAAQKCHSGDDGARRHLEFQLPIKRAHL